MPGRCSLRSAQRTAAPGWTTGGSTGPAQAAALVERLGGLVLTEAQWGESAAALLLRA